MNDRIRVLRRADRDVDRIVWWIVNRQKSPEGAASWYRAYESCLQRLAQSARDQPFAPENDFAEFEVRHMTFKTRSGRMYRLLFTIVGNEIRILHVRGPGQDLVRPEELVLIDDDSDS